jgi:hypothetical protein
MLGWYLAAVILGVLVALMTIFHDQVCRHGGTGLADGRLWSG